MGVDDVRRDVYARSHKDFSAASNQDRSSRLERSLLPNTRRCGRLRCSRSSFATFVRAKMRSDDRFLLALLLPGEIKAPASRSVDDPTLLGGFRAILLRRRVRCPSRLLAPPEHLGG